jgi:hypothetical protein
VERLLLASTGEAVLEHLLALDAAGARRRGAAARRRLLTEHTWAQRAVQVEAMLTDGRHIRERLAG